MIKTKYILNTKSHVQNSKIKIAVCVNAQVIIIQYIVFVSCFDNTFS